MFFVLLIVKYTVNNLQQNHEKMHFVFLVFNPHTLFFKAFKQFG